MSDKRGKHRTTDKEMERTIKWLESLDCVDKVVLERVESCRHKSTTGSVRIKKELDNGVKLAGYTSLGVVDIFIKSNDIEKLKELISKEYCEFVGSGYCQIISPLIPYTINNYNLKLGNKIYKELLNFIQQTMKNV